MSKALKIGVSAIPGIGSAFAASEASKQQREAIGQAERASARQAALGRSDIRSSLRPTLGELTAGATQAQQSLQPIAQTGLGAFDIQAAISGALGPEAQAQAFQNFQASPEQAFLQQEAEQASLRGASATGGLGGGRIQQELQRQAIGFGSQNIQDRFNRLGSIAGQGIQAQTNLANLQSSLGSARAQAQQTAGLGLANIAVGQAAPQAALRLASGDARAAGTLGTAAGLQQFTGLLSGGFGGGGSQPSASQGFFSGSRGR